jgi:hypothetical protein
MANKENLVTHVGTLMKNLPELHDIEFKVGFNLNENTFFQKLIQKDLLEKGVRVKPVDYFRALGFLSYFTGVIEDDYNVCDNLVTISKKLREVEKKAGLDGEYAYVKLGTVVMEAGLCAQERGNEHYSDPLTIEAIRSRFENQGPIVDFGSENLRKADPYYIAMGHKVYDTVSEERREFLEGVSSRGDLIALIFSDCIMGVLDDKNYISNINQTLSGKNYFGASAAAMEGLRKEASLPKLESFIGDIKDA